MEAGIAAEKIGRIKSKCGCIMNSISEMIFSSRLLNFKVAYLSQI